MSKHTYHFKHDFNAHNDEKIIDLRMDLGMEGYGIFWYLIELLANTEGYKLNQSYKRLAFTIQTSEEHIQKVVEDYGLFILEDGLFYSQSLIDRMSKLDEIKRKRAEAGAKGGKAKAIDKQKQANAKQKQAEESKGEESKVKDRREEESKRLKDLDPLLNSLKDLGLKGFPRANGTLTSLQKKVYQRLKSFDDSKIIEAVNKNLFLSEESWFNFEFVFRSDENIEKLMNGHFDFKKPQEVESGSRPILETKPVIYEWKPKPDDEIHNDRITARINLYWSVRPSKEDEQRLNLSEPPSKREVDLYNWRIKQPLGLGKAGLKPLIDDCGEKIEYPPKPFTKAVSRIEICK